MELIDRRSFARGILFGAAVAAAGLAVSSETLQAMPRDDRAPGASTTGSRRRRRWWFGRSRVAALAAGSGVAGGIGAAASAAGAGCDLTHTAVIDFADRPAPADLEQRIHSPLRHLLQLAGLRTAEISGGFARPAAAPPHFCNAFVLKRRFDSRMPGVLFP